VLYHMSEVEGCRGGGCARRFWSGTWICADPYGSLDGGSPRNFLGDEGNKKGDGKDDDPEDDDPEPRSPNIDIKSAKRARISRIVIYQLRVTYGVRQTKILEAIVTPNLQPAGYVVACVLFSKMQDARWRII
jgi:hypothetical protein